MGVVCSFDYINARCRLHIFVLLLPSCESNTLFINRQPRTCNASSLLNSNFFPQRPQLSIQNFCGYKLDEECGEYDVLRVEHLDSERDSEYDRERGTHRKKKYGAGGAQVPGPANSYKVHLALYQNSSASNGSSSGGNLRWQSSGDWRCCCLPKYTRACAYK